ncbi:MAG: TetR/AcrR family transcriptional regulator [Rhodoferax sp.]|nr:TetR/AcrR family transcriptional regulator [Rhodoferax sp.]
MIDRRVQKTLLALHRALIALILEKGYDAITIKDIIDRANVGRSTFYAHYTDKGQLLASGLIDLGKALSAHQKAERVKHKGAAVPFSFSLPLFKHAQEYKDVYRAMLGRQAGAVVAGHLRDVLTELVTDDLTMSTPRTSPVTVPTEALIQFIVGAVMSMLTWWVDEPTGLGADEVDMVFRQLTLAASPASTALSDRPCQKISA